MNRLITGLYRQTGRVVVVLYFAFLLAPVVIMIPASFTANEILEFPPQSYSMRWYEFVLASSEWRRSALVSFRIALGAMVISTACGMFIGFTIYRFGRINNYLRLLYLSPMLIPHIVVAAGLFDLLVPMHLLGSELVLMVGHATMSLPISVVVAIAAFETVDRTFWTAASTLGARGPQIVGMVIMPIIATSIVACLILAFENSWHEVTLAVFIGPGLTPTLPNKLFTLLQQENSPAFASISTMLLLVTVVLGIILAKVSRQKKSVKVEADNE